MRINYCIDPGNLLSCAKGRRLAAHGVTVASLHFDSRASTSGWLFVTVEYSKRNCFSFLVRTLAV